MESRKEVYKILEWKDGYVYKTKKICDVWLPLRTLTVEEERKILQLVGGDQLVNTKDVR